MKWIKSKVDGKDCWILDTSLISVYIEDWGDYGKNFLGRYATRINQYEQLFFSKSLKEAKKFCLENIEKNYPEIVKGL